MASLNDSVNMNTDNVGPVVTPNPAPAGTPPINYGSTTTRTTFPQPVPASPDVLGLWNSRSSGLPTRGRLLPISNTVVASATSTTGGTAGSPGAAGATGAAGTRGSLWYEGAGAPGTITGQMNNDFYLNTTNGDVYELVAGVWTLELNITGPTGAAGATGGQIIVTQANSFSAGQAVYFNGTNWVLAESNASGTLGVALVAATGLSGSAFIAILMGMATGLSGLTAGQYYFVSDATPGALTATEPTAAGSFSNPIFLALTTTTGFVLPFRPSQVAVPDRRALTKTANYAAVAGDVIFCDTSAGGFTITLPLSSVNSSMEIVIKKISADGNAVIVAVSGSDKIDLSATAILDQSGDALDVIADGTSNWGIV